MRAHRDEGVVAAGMPGERYSSAFFVPLGT